jgi:hypothetical protein
MSEAIEHAKESIEHAQHAHHQEGHNAARWIAVLIAVLAAALAICDMAAKSSQNSYLTYHIALSNDYAFYQAKNARATIRSTEATLLESLPNAPGNEAIQAKIKEARAQEARLRDEPGKDGMKQLMEMAEQNKAKRAAAEHTYHAFEFVVGLLQISIVLASVSVVTRMSVMAYGAGLLGGGAALYALLAALHIV